MSHFERLFKLSCIALDDVTNRCGVDVKSYSESVVPKFTSRVKETSFNNLGCSHLSVIVGGSVHVPSFGNTVVFVILLCSEEQVCRLDARWVITVVTDIHTIRYWAVSEFISDAVGVQWLRVRATGSYHSIATSGSAHPDQTSSDSSAFGHSVESNIKWYGVAGQSYLLCCSCCIAPQGYSCISKNV